MNCRMSSQRGHPPPDGVDYDYVMGLFDALNPWIKQLTLDLDGEDKDGR